MLEWKSKNQHKETTVKIFKKMSINATLLSDLPFKTEAAMEAYLIENKEVLALDHQDYTNVDIIGCQLAFNDSRLDILAGYNQTSLAVIEVKNKILDMAAYSQLEGYLTNWAQIYNTQKDLITEYMDLDPDKVGWSGILVGTSISPQLASLIDCNGDASSNNASRHPILAFVIKRLIDKNGNTYVITELYQPQRPRNGRDYTKYIYKNSNYGKARLVLAVIKDYVQNKPGITFDGLRDAFPLNLQGSITLPLFRRLDEIGEDPKLSKRYFSRYEDQIELNDKATIVVTNQWGIGNIGTFLKHVETIKSIDRIEEVRESV